MRLHRHPMRTIRQRGLANRKHIGDYVSRSGRAAVGMDFIRANHISGSDDSTMPSQTADSNQCYKTYKYKISSPVAGSRRLERGEQIIRPGADDLHLGLRQRVWMAMPAKTISRQRNALTRRVNTFRCRVNAIICRGKAITVGINAIIRRGNAIILRGNVIILGINAITVGINAIIRRGNAIIPRENTIILGINVITVGINVITVGINVIICRRNAFSSQVKTFSTLLNAFSCLLNPFRNASQRPKSR